MQSLPKTSPSSERYQCDGVSQYDAPDAVTDQVHVRGQEPDTQNRMTASFHLGYPGEYGIV